MVIRDNSGIRCFRRRVANSARQAIVWVICAMCLSAGSALAAPYAQPGQAFHSWHEWAAWPVMRAGYEPSPYAARPVHARRWEPEPAPYTYEPAVSHAKPDCAEEHPVVQTNAVQETGVHRSPETYEEPCGVRCWYARLRAGYCGRGCDYYRFRMTRFPEGPLGQERVHVACR